jgi:CRISPR-associated endonuclease/helicase Cas3
MKKQQYFAHLKKEIKKPHLLEDHLKKVAKKAEDFIFNTVLKALINPAGKWHDLGKYRKKFQDYISSVTEVDKENAHLEPAEYSTNNKKKVAKTTHSMAGAVHARKKLGTLSDVLAYIIAGHHAGLADGNGGNAKPSDLEYRLHNADAEYNESMIADIPNEILDIDKSIINEQAIAPFFQDKHACALTIRILFSALVDADFLDTEAYMLGKERQYNYDYIENLYTKYTNHMQGFSNNEQNTINKLRQQIQRDCLIKAELPSGIFSLTVPTGGGKTLASLGFALKHALKHNKRRIIYAIPFTSIIEQTVKVFKEILGENNILEHHSNLEATEETNSSRLAAENWDAPIIVTTNVQLFESLHASRTSRCRKLHRLQDSIIILDEAQQLPRELHQPIVNSINSLATYFNVSWVLCTATQPVFTTTKTPGYENKTEFFGLNNVTEMCENKEDLQQQGS